MSASSATLEALLAIEPADERERLRSLLKSPLFRQQFVAVHAEQPHVAAGLRAYGRLSATATRRPLMTTEIGRPDGGIMLLGMDHVGRSEYFESCVGTGQTFPLFAEALGLFAGWPDKGEREERAYAFAHRQNIYHADVFRAPPYTQKTLKTTAPDGSQVTTVHGPLTAAERMEDVGRTLSLMSDLAERHSGLLHVLCFGDGGRTIAFGAEELGGSLGPTLPVGIACVTQSGLARDVAEYGNGTASNIHRMLFFTDEVRDDTPYARVIFGRFPHLAQVSPAEATILLPQLATHIEDVLAEESSSEDIHVVVKHDLKRGLAFEAWEMNGRSLSWDVDIHPNYYEVDVEDKTGAAVSSRRPLTEDRACQRCGHVYLAGTIDIKKFQQRSSQCGLQRRGYTGSVCGAFVDQEPCDACEACTLRKAAEEQGRIIPMRPTAPGVIDVASLR